MKNDLDKGIECARRLGEIESERAGAAAKAKVENYSREERLQRRTNAIALVEDIRRSLKRAKADEETTAKILGPILKAAENARKKSEAPVSATPVSVTPENPAPVAQ